MNDKFCSRPESSGVMLCWIVGAPRAGQRQGVKKAKESSSVKAKKEGKIDDDEVTEENLGKPVYPQ